MATPMLWEPCKNKYGYLISDLLHLEILADWLYMFCR